MKVQAKFYRLVQESWHIRAVSPEPSLVILNEWDLDKDSGQILWASSRTFGTFALSRQSLRWFH